MFYRKYSTFRYGYVPVRVEECPIRRRGHTYGWWNGPAEDGHAGVDIGHIYQVARSNDVPEVNPIIPKIDTP